jgi:hypothetical protein
MQGVIEQSGFTDYQAGQMVTLSVVLSCQRHTALLERITAAYQPERLVPT